MRIQRGLSVFPLYFRAGKSIELAALAILLIAFARTGISADLISHTIRPDISKLQISPGGEYDRVEYGAGWNWTRPGEPVIPVVILRLAVPPGLKAMGVRIDRAEYIEMTGSFRLRPGQPAVSFDASLPAPVPVDPVEGIYRSTDPYPAVSVRLVSQADVAGQSFVTVEAAIIRYTPAERRVEFLAKLTFTVEGVTGYEPGGVVPVSLSEESRARIEKELRDLVENDDDIRLPTAAPDKGIQQLPSPGPFEHVIVAPPSLVSIYQPLVDWHMRRGLRDTIVTPQWIRANYGGTADTVKFRNFIIDAYTEWGTRYVLLGAEADSIPFCRRSYASKPAAVSDHYYGDFNDDWYYDVAIGRVTEYNTILLSAWVDKVLTYEISPPLDGYSRNFCFLGMDLDTIYPTNGELLKDSLATWLLSPDINLTTIYDSDPTDHRLAFITALNAGQNIVNHWEHGSHSLLGTGAERHSSSVTWTDLWNLGNIGRYTTMVVFACEAAKMDYTDCIGELYIFANEDNGGVAFVGNTGTGLYDPGDPVSLSGDLDVLWWQGLLAEGRYCVGEALQWMKNHAPFAEEDEKWCDWVVNLIGDPAMPLWTDSIRIFSVSHADSIPPGPGSFGVHVEDAGQPVESAYVCLWKEQEVYERGYTDAAGDVIFGTRPDYPGEVLITVVGQNFLPYQDSATVGGIGDLNAYWDASSGTFPDSACPGWTRVEQNAPPAPALAGDSLVLTTTTGTEDFYYSMDDPIFVPTDTVAIQFRARFVSGSSMAPERPACQVSLGIGGNSGTLLGLNQDQIFLWADMDIIGEQSTLDTDDSAHTYRMVVIPSGEVGVYRDDSLILSGQVFSDASWPAAVAATWGDRFSEAYGTVNWCYFGYVSVDTDSDGIPNGCDNCVDIFNPGQLDGDDDGIGDVCDGHIRVLNLDSDGDGSLYWALGVANSRAGRDTISFDVSGTIVLSSPLPIITDDSLILRGSSAPGGIYSAMIDGSGLISGNGLEIQSSSNVIEGLSITGFPGNGVAVIGASSIGNTITNNLIHDNGGLAIDLGDDGITANDIDDLDTGPNDLLNYPVFDSAVSQADESYIVYGQADSLARVEFFVAHPAADSTSPADPLGHGEAYSYIGFTIAGEDGSFQFAVPNTVKHFSEVTATAIDYLGNTSEFCENIVLVPAPLIVVAYSPVNIIIADSLGHILFGKDSLNNLIDSLPPDEAFYSDAPEDSVEIFHPILGTYIINFVTEAGTPQGMTYSAIIRTDGSQEMVLVVDRPVPESGVMASFLFDMQEGFQYINGDASGDEAINIGDPVFLIDYIFRGGPAPYPLASGDANCDGAINIADAVYLITYIFKGGPAPCYLER